MNNRHMRAQAIDEADIVVARRGGQVGVTQIEAHADMPDGNRIERLQTLKQFVEELRRMVRSILDRKLQTGCANFLHQRENAFNVSLQASFMEQVDIKQHRAEIPRKFQILNEQLLGFSLKWIGLPAGMD